MRKVTIALAGISLAAVLGFGGRAVVSTAHAQAAGGAQRIETTVHDSWSVTCRDTAEKKNNCTAVLRVADNKNGNVILVWAVGKDAEGKLTAVLQTPTGVQVGKGVALKIGNAAERTLAYASCSARQCEATTPVDAAFLKEVSAGAEAAATITLIDGRTAEFKFPLTGSAAALKQVAGS